MSEETEPVTTVRVVATWPRIAPQYGLIRVGDKADIPIELATKLAPYVQPDVPNVGVWVDTEPT